MKKSYIYIVLLTLSIGLISCSEGPINEIKFDNKAAGDVYVNFRGTQIFVPSQGTATITDIDKGEFDYETVFVIPAGVTSFEAADELAGTFTLKAGTKILVIYSSVIEEDVYKIFASITNSDNLAEDGILPNPINP